MGSNRLLAQRQRFTLGIERTFEYGWRPITEQGRQLLIPGLETGTGRGGSDGVDLGRICELDQPGDSDRPGAVEEKALDHILAEIARVNGRAACKEGGVPTDSAYVSSTGHIDLDAIPADDEATLELFGSARTLGCFDSLTADFTPPSYQSAWLKAHFPVEFLTGVLEHNPTAQPRHALIAEARRIGIPLLPIDINASGDRHRVERIGPEVKGIRLPLSEVTGISDTEVAAILDGQPYVSITDVHHRVHPSRTLMMSLAAVGVFDSLVSGMSGGSGSSGDRGISGRSGRGDCDAGGAVGDRRGDIIAFVRQLSSRPRKKTSLAGHIPLLTDETLAEAGVPDPSAPVSKAAVDRGNVVTDPATPTRALAPFGVEEAHPPGEDQADEEHVVDSYRPMLDELGATSADAALGLRSGAQVLVGGMRTRPQNSSLNLDGNAETVGLVDSTGCIDAAIVDRTGRGDELDLFAPNRMLVRGRTRRTDDDVVFIEAEEILDLDELWTTWLDAR